MLGNISFDFSVYLNDREKTSNHENCELNVRVQYSMLKFYNKIKDQMAKKWFQSNKSAQIWISNEKYVSLKKQIEWKKTT